MYIILLLYRRWTHTHTMYCKSNAQYEQYVNECYKLFLNNNNNSKGFHSY